MITTTSYGFNTVHSHAYFLRTYSTYLQYLPFCIPPIMQVLLSQICDPVHKEYQQQPTYFFSSFLFWQTEQPLKEKIKHGQYPPCIHMDVMYDDPAVRQEVVTTLKIYTLCDIPEPEPLSLTMKVPSELPLTIVFCYVFKRY